MDREDSAIGPIHGEESTLIFGREFCAVAEGNACQRTDADVKGGRQNIRIISRPLGGAFAEAVLAARNQVVNAGGAIPRHAPIPFHVAVESKHFAVTIERKVIRVAHAAGDYLPVLSILIAAQNESPRRL